MWGCVSFYPVTTNCAQCGCEYTFWEGCIVMTIYTDPGCGFCSLECARARLLYLILQLSERANHMKMTPDIYEKIVCGDALTDAELQCAATHFADLAERLEVLGPRFQFAFAECNRRAGELQGYIRARAAPSSV